MLERGDEGKLHAFPLFIARLGCCAARRESDRFVGVGLEPGGLRGRRAGRNVALDRRAKVVREGASASPLELGQAYIRGDRIQPRPPGVRVAQRVHAAPRAQQRLLERVVGVGHRAGHPVAVCVELGSVLLDPLGETEVVIRGSHPQRCSTTISEWPVGSRSQNIGGTGSPIRDTSASTSTLRDFSSAWVASMSPVYSVMPVSAGTTSVPGRGGARAMPVLPSGGYTSIHRYSPPNGTSVRFSKPSAS